jgi:hypothetical protein
MGLRWSNVLVGQGQAQEERVRGNEVGRDLAWVVGKVSYHPVVILHLRRWLNWLLNRAIR